MITPGEINVIARGLGLDQHGLRDAAELALHRPLPLALPTLDQGELSRVRDYLLRLPATQLAV